MMGFADGSTHPTGYQVHTRPRVQRASGVPHALFGRKIQQSLGRIARRGREVVSTKIIQSDRAHFQSWSRERACEEYRPHPEERALARLEGWPRVPVLRPSFETLASQAPQDEVRIPHSRESGRPSIPRRQRWNRRAAAYWILRWSLSSGSPKARPGGGV